MCGIVGIFQPPGVADPRRLACVKPMAEALRHRGPDGGDYWIDESAGVAFGHRRLAIVDLSEAGRQPMASENGALVTTFNGEIYNFADLRTELEQAGHCFRGHSDTEVMLAAFSATGIERALPRFAGMFAVAVWDRDQRVLHLIRDRMGKKPLYIALCQGALLFASELKAICAYPFFRSEIDLDAVAAMLRYGWVPDDQCIWRNAFKLPPGAILSLNEQDLRDCSVHHLKAKARLWWSIPDLIQDLQTSPRRASDAELEEELDDLLRLVVRQRMVADVPLGAFLSAGIDSSIVTALMQSQSSKPIRTFTIGFSEDGYDEANHAARMAQHLGVEHTEFRVTVDNALALAPELPTIWDEPFADESQIPTLLLSRLARDHVTVAMTGDGGDECFGGYSRHLLSQKLVGLLKLPKSLRRAAANAMRAMPDQALRTMMGFLAPSAGAIHASSRLDLPRLLALLESDDEGDLYDRLIATNPASSFLGEAASENATQRHISQLPDAAARFMCRDMLGYLRGDILVKLDRASMAASLEARCPLLDHRVVEFALRLPTALKLRDDKGKWLLRRVLARYAPRTLFERPKQGFDAPISTWLAGPLRGWASDLLASDRLDHDGFVDAAQARRCWNEFLNGRRDRWRELWAILMFNAWLETAPVASAITAPPLTLETAFKRAPHLGGLAPAGLQS